MKTGPVPQLFIHSDWFRALWPANPCSVNINSRLMESTLSAFRGVFPSVCSSADTAALKWKKRFFCFFFKSCERPNRVSICRAGSRRDHVSVIAPLFALFLQAGSTTASSSIPLVLYDVWRSRGLPGWARPSSDQTKTIPFGKTICSSLFPCIITSDDRAAALTKLTAAAEILDA